MKPLLIAALLLLPAAGALAEESRYRLEPAGEGYVRMDTVTGETAYCELADGQFSCRAAREDAGASAAIAKRVAALEARVAELEKANPADALLPSDEEFERGLGYMEKFMRRFIGIARELDGDRAPDRT